MEYIQVHVSGAIKTWLVIFEAGTPGTATGLSAIEVPDRYGAKNGR